MGKNLSKALGLGGQLPGALGPDLCFPSLRFFTEMLISFLEGNYVLMTEIKLEPSKVQTFLAS